MLHLAPLYQFMTEHLPSASLSEEKHERATFSLPLHGAKLSEVFRLLGDNKETLHISDYSLSQASLEQVFLRISGDANAEEDP